MPDTAAMVREFHETYGLPVRTEPTAHPDEAHLRWKLLKEEFLEYRDALGAGDVIGIADALADMAYVIHGTALAHGIDLNAVLAEVHRSNMSKLGADGNPVRREDGKVLKGPAYFPPDIARVLALPEGEATG